MIKGSKFIAGMLIVTAISVLQVMDVKAEKYVQEEDAQSYTNTVQEVYINPLYETVIKESDLNKASDNTGIRPYSNTEYADNVEEAAAQIRTGMKNREETVIVYYKAPEYVNGIMREIAEQALIHTGNPVEGDYLRWQYGGWEAEGTVEKSPEENMSYMVFTYTYTYYTTYEQEMQVTEKINEVLDGLDAYHKSDYDKIHAVYDYVCRNTTYDYDNLNDDTYKLKYTAYAALIDKKVVCQGFAVLLYRLWLELEIDNRVISGVGNQEPHGWNIVYLGGKYYNADATWDAGNSEYEYFLKSDTNFKEHERDEIYKTDEFYHSYPMSDSDYIIGKVPEITSVYSQVGTSAKVTWTSVHGADGYELFRAERPDAVEQEWILTKTIPDGNILQYTNNGLTEGKTYYYKVRAFVREENGTKTYSDFSNVNYMPSKVLFDNPYSNSDSRIRILWNEVAGAHGYQIWRKNEDDSFSIVKTLGDKGDILTEDQGAVVAYSNTGLESGKIYTYRMRAFSILNGKKVFGAFSDEVSVAVLPQKTTIILTSTKRSSVSITWNYVSGAAGYQIWRADNLNGEFSIVKSITNGDVNSYINNGLISGQTYWYKVRPYTEIKGKKTFGEFSEIQNIVVK